MLRRAIHVVEVANLVIGAVDAAVDHQLRWARTYRNCRPGGYFTSIFTHGTLWATLNLLYNQFSPAACLIAVAVYGVRIATAGSIARRCLAAQLDWRGALLVPVKD